MSGKPADHTTSDAPLVWIDCEMTGLNTQHDTILSIACILTDSQLLPLTPEPFSAVIQHTSLQLSRMGEWCTRTHTSTGLVAACLSSTTTATSASSDLLSYIKQHISEPGLALLAGNSVHVDKEFLRREPWDAVLNHLHYRILDVSTLKEAARRWGGRAIVEGAPRKVGAHTAVGDVGESLEEAKYWKGMLFDGLRGQEGGGEKG